MIWNPARKISSAIQPVVERQHLALLTDENSRGITLQELIIFTDYTFLLRLQAIFVQEWIKLCSKL